MVTEISILSYQQSGVCLTELALAQTTAECGDVHLYSRVTQEAEAGGQSSRPPGLHSQTLFSSKVKVLS